MDVIPTPGCVLVIRRRALGDVLVSMSVMQELRRRWPNARLDFVVDRAAAAVVENSPYIDELLIYDRKLYSQGTPLQRLALLRTWLRRLRARQPDLVLDLMGTPQTAMWTYATGASTRVGLRRRWRSWAYTHHVERETKQRFAGERFLDWIRAMELQASPWQPTPVFRSPELDSEAAAHIDKGEGPVVLLNPSATWPAKAWPLGHFAALGQRLKREVGARVFVSWGPGEEQARDVVHRLSEGDVEAMPATDIPQLAAWCAQSDLVVTTDSGPKHIAMAEGASTLTLYGSTDPLGWQPPGAEHSWLTNEVPCRPCNRLECNVVGHPCLDDLSVDRVFSMCVSILSDSGAGESQ